MHTTFLFFAVKPVLMAKSSQYGSKAEGVDGVVWKIGLDRLVVLLKNQYTVQHFFSKQTQLIFPKPYLLTTILALEFVSLASSN